MNTGKLTGDLAYYCDVVLRGRNYMFHGKSNDKAISLLLCTCAVAQLLRFLSKMPSTPVAADACEASALHLMQRMGISHVNMLLQEVVASHSAM